MSGDPHPGYPGIFELGGVYILLPRQDRPPGAPAGVLTVQGHYPIFSSDFAASEFLARHPEFGHYEAARLDSQGLVVEVLERMQARGIATLTLDPEPNRVRPFPIAEAVAALRAGPS